MFSVDCTTTLETDLIFSTTEVPEEETQTLSFSSKGTLCSSKPGERAFTLSKEVPKYLPSSMSGPQLFRETLGIASLPSPLALATPHPSEKKEAQKPPLSFAHKNQEPSARPSARPSSSLPHSPSRPFAKASSLATTRSSSLTKSTSPSSKSPLSSKTWSPIPTLTFWENRYHPKTKNDQGRQQQGQDSHDPDENPSNKKQKMEAIAGVGKGKAAPPPSSSSFKPLLAPPKLGVFALYYVLTKIGIWADGASSFAYKKEIETLDINTTETYKKRLEDIKKAIKKEQAAARWGIAVKIFTWMTSLSLLITGIALVATGVGAIAGSLLIVAGVFSVTNQIMEITGAWREIANKLPGDNPEYKKAVASWIQMGISILCLILSGAGAIWGGFSQFSEAMQLGSAAMGSIAAIGNGTTTIGEGVSQGEFKYAHADIRVHDKHLSRLKHRRTDLMDKVEWSLDRIKQLFEDLSVALGFEEEIFQADQMIYR